LIPENPFTIDEYNSSALPSQLGTEALPDPAPVTKAKEAIFNPLLERGPTLAFKEETTAS
jgi:threonine synthase